MGRRATATQEMVGGLVPRRARPRSEMEQEEAPRLAVGLWRTFKMLLLLIVITASLISTTFLDRASQVFVLKLFLVLFLSLLPGWLYLQFIEAKGAGLYDEYVLNLYRLRIDDIAGLPKPPPGSRYWDNWHRAVTESRDGVDVSRNIYLKKFEATYGRSAVPESRRRRTKDTDGLRMKGLKRVAERVHADAFSPVLLATALLCVGWTAFVQPDLYRELHLLSLGPSGAPVVPIDALRFGFLGAYAFLLQSLVRRYFQIDLKARSYVSVILRVIVVAAIVVTIHPLWLFYKLSPELELVVAFLVGFFPDEGLRLLRRGLVGAVSWLPFTGDRDSEYPLGDLDGLNIYYEIRLLEEGVEDIQNLTTANLVDMMLNTRVPIGRLVDWVDQAFLYLRVCDNASQDRVRLRRIGIRTATDLIDALEATGEASSFHRKVSRVLNTRQDGSDDGGPSATEGIYHSLKGEVNLWHLQKWKQHSWLKEDAISSPEEVRL